MNIAEYPLPDDPDSIVMMPHLLSEFIRKGPEHPDVKAAPEWFQSRFERDVEAFHYAPVSAIPDILEEGINPESETKLVYLTANEWHEYVEIADQTHRTARVQVRLPWACRQFPKAKPHKLKTFVYHRVPPSFIIGIEINAHLDLSKFIREPNAAGILRSFASVADYYLPRRPVLPQTVTEDEITKTLACLTESRIEAAHSCAPSSDFKSAYRAPVNEAEVVEFSNDFLAALRAIAISS